MANLPIPDEQTWITYTSQTGTGPFSFTFSIFSKADLRVRVGGVELSQSDFTFTGTLIDTGYDGGSITLVTAATADDVLIWREVTPARTSDFSPASSVSIASIDAALDRLTAHAQDARRDAARSFKVALGEEAVERTYDEFLSEAADGISAAALALVAAAGDAELADIEDAGDGQIEAIAVAAALVIGEGGTIDVAEAAAISAIDTEAGTQILNIKSTPGSPQYASADAALSKGVSSVSISAGGSGGTNGTYPWTTTGGTGVGASGLLTVSGGAITAITVETRGTGYTTGETLAYTVAGLTGETLAVNRSQNETAGESFLVPVADGFESFTVNSGGTTASSNGVVPKLTAINPNLPLTPDGIKILEYGEDGNGVGRIIRGINVFTGAPIYPGLALDEALTTTRTPLCLNGGVALQLFGADRRAITVDPRTGIITPSQGAATSGAYDSLFPSDPRLLVSDYWSIDEQSADTLKFIRGITDSNGYQHCSPGSRVGITTNARVVRFRVYWNGLVTRDDAQNMIGGVWVDGALNSTFENQFGAAGTGEQWVSVDLGSSAVREVALVWPYGDGMELREVQVSRGAAVLAASDRPTTKLVPSGDSITHGFYATNIFTSWPWKLAVAKGHQLINIANGSAQVVASDALTLSETGAEQVIYAIGYNNFVAQTSLVTFQADLEDWITNARAELPSAKIYIASMIYTPNTDTITPADYRSATAAAEAAAGDANTFYVDGLSLMTNNTDRLLDGIHPNDTGAAEIAAAYGSIID